jgi:hypothetical protein
MIWNVGIVIIMIWGFFAVLYLLGALLLGFPERTVDDVVQFLRPVDLDQAEVLLDPGANHELRWKLDADTYREIQRKRIHSYLELLRRMAHNSMILVEFGNREAARLERSSQQERGRRQAEVIAALQRAAVNVRIYSIFTIVKLAFLMAIRPMLTPSLASFRTTAELDGIQSYKTLREVSTVAFEEFRRSTEKLVLNF